MKKEYTFSDELDEFSAAYDQEPDYTKPLFHDDERRGYFFESETRADLLKKLSHLIEYTKLVLFVNGQDQVGKTELMKHRFITQAKTNWRVCFIDAIRCKSTQSILKALAKDLGISELDQKSKQSAERFVEQLNEFRQNNLHAILVVDNAQHLSQETSELIAQLSQYNEQLRPLLRTVLFGTQFPEKLKSLLQELNGDDAVQTLNIEPLTHEETESYIVDALKRLRIEQLGPFTEQRIQHIHQQAKGLFKPTRILAQAVWQSHIDSLNKTDNATKSSKKGWPVRKILHVASGGLAVALIASLVFFIGSKPGKNTQMAQDQTTQELALPDDDASDVKNAEPPSSTNTSVATNEENTTSEPTTDTASIDEIPEVVAQATDVNKSVETPKKAAEKAPLIETKEVVRPAVIAPAPPKPPAKAKPQVAKNNGIKRENWLALQSTNSYTVQLLGSSRESAVQNFIKANKLENKAAYFHSKRNNKDWYTVVYGVYKDRASAIKAGNEVQKTLKIKNPWIRSIASVHKDIGLESFASQ